ISFQCTSGTSRQVIIVHKLLFDSTQSILRTSLLTLHDVIINDGLGNEVSVVHRLLEELVNSRVSGDQHVISQSPASRRQLVDLTFQVLSYPSLTQITGFLVN